MLPSVQKFCVAKGIFRKLGFSAKNPPSPLSRNQILIFHPMLLLFHQGVTDVFWEICLYWKTSLVCWNLSFLPHLLQIYFLPNTPISNSHSQHRLL